MEFSLERIGKEDWPSVIAWIHEEFHAEVHAQMVQWMHDELRDHALDFIGMRCESGGRCCFAAYGGLYPGNLGVLCGHRLASEVDLEWAGQFFPLWAEWMFERGASWIQYVQRDRDERTSQILQFAGFRRLATLVQMALVEFADWGTEDSSSRAISTWRSFGEGEDGRWKELIARTFVDTADCPEINTFRTMEETWDGYVASARGEMGEWWRLTSEEADVGCLLLTPLGKGEWELTYMGIVPEQRRRGWTAAFLAQAKRRCAAKHVERLILAVDTRNLGAWKVYDRAGFQPLQTMQAWFAKRDGFRSS